MKNKQLTTLQLHKIFDIGRKCGIGHAMFINFGTLLGYVRDKDLIDNDDDTDVCIRSDWVKAEDEKKFYKMLIDEGMFEFRGRRAIRKDTNRLLWLTLKNAREGDKSCVWFMFPWKKHLYHCKGKRWLKKIGMKPQVIKDIPGRENGLFINQTIMKGNTLKYFEKLIPVKFIGGVVNVPWMFGSLLDEYYPNWARPGRGASSRYNLVLIKKWEVQDSWMVIKE